MPTRRYFILNNPCGGDTVQTMIGRVVRDIYEPLNDCAPWEPQTQALLADLLPKPQTSTNRKECLVRARNTEAYAKLAYFFHIDVGKRPEEHITLESHKINRYTLENPGKKFEKLMENNAYASEVRELLKARYPHRAYLVTGILTTTKSKWVKNSGMTDSQGAGFTVPGSEIAGIPIPNLNLSLGVSHQVEVSNRSELCVEDEEIFAIAYNLVQLKRTKDKGTNQRRAVVGDIVWAKKQHAALSHDEKYALTEDDESDESDDQEEEEEENNRDDTAITLLPDTQPMVGKTDTILEMDD